MLKRTLKLMRGHIGLAGISFVLTGLLGWSTGALAAAAAPPTVSISQVPMTITIPAHPQILLAVANSESTDGTLAGAIMTGSGLFPDLQNSSSPLNYAIPGGFTPPVNAGNGVTAPYTVASGGNQVDNSASRLNVAKAGIINILNNYIPYADFGLLDYTLPGLTEAPTWVYQMSPPISATNPTGEFMFTSAQVAGNRYVVNPCYQYTNRAVSNITPGGAVYNDCVNLNNYYLSQNIAAQQWMAVSSSSDDPSINDVLYDPYGGVGPVCITTTNGPAYVPNPPNPFPPSPPGFSLNDFNNGGVTESYPNGVNCVALQTGPTNAGFVPYSAQVMYAQRGFGYYTGQQSGDLNAATVLVPIGASTSAGATPTAASVAAALTHFMPYLQPETNSTGTGEIKAAGVQSPIAGLIAQANHFYATVNPPSTNGCAASRYVVLITDGLPTLDSSGKAWPPLGSAAANNAYNAPGATLPYGYGVSATFNADGSLGTPTNDQALIDAVNQLTLLANSGVKTYIIAVGAGVNPLIYPTAAATLTAMAIAGGTGQYYPATSPQAVSQDLQLIIATILSTDQATSSAAVNSTGLNTNSVVYQSQFDSADTYQDWTGNLFAFNISVTTGVVDTTPADALWSGQTKLDAQSPDTRLIATWDPVAGTAAPFVWSPSPSTTGIAAATVIGQDLEAYIPDTNGQDVVEYLRGSSVNEQRNGGTFRNRTHKLGDIVDSNPLYVGAPGGNSQASSYTTFEQTYANRPPVLYVGADDGMLHAFDAATGNERFAYIPTGVYGNLINLVSPFYNAQHRFYVNGSPQASDVQFSDNSWHTVLVSAEQAGGNSVFAMDVTNPTAISNQTLLAQSVLWDFTDPDMGLGYSTPAIALTADTSASWLVFFGNGYNSRNQKPFLYAVDAQTGGTNVNVKIDLCAAVPSACNLAASNGLSTVIAVNSGGQIAGNANLIYAGDLQGNLWRVNTTNPNPANWTVTVLFQARDSLGNPQPITTTPVATLNPRYPQVLGTMVFVGTGQLLGIPDLTDQKVQTVYGIYDPPNSFATPVLRSQLVQQSLADATLDGQTVRMVTGNAVSIPTSEGWFIDLDAVTGATVTANGGVAQITGGTVTDQGERIVTDPRLESGGVLVFTTYQPTANVCAAGGSSFLMMINYATGGSFTSPQFALTGTTINSTDSLAASNSTGSGTTLLNPVGESLGNVFAAGPTIENANFATASKIKLITESSGAIQSVTEKGSSKNRTAWWEIRQ